MKKALPDQHKPQEEHFDRPARPLKELEIVQQVMVASNLVGIKTLDHAVPGLAAAEHVLLIKPRAKSIKYHVQDDS
ncbi:hypothetical protein Trydic_g6265 [Trypoxylus dichotomus]